MSHQYHEAGPSAVEESFLKGAREIVGSTVQAVMGIVFFGLLWMMLGETPKQLTMGDSSHGHH